MREKNLFLGSIVLKRTSESDRTEIIDGQQRMLTMTILFAAMRDLLSDLGQDKVANELHNRAIVHSPDLLSEDVIILPTPGLRDFFKRSVQSSEPDFANPVTPEEKRVVRNYTWLKNELRAGLETYDGRPEKFVTDAYNSVRNLKIIEIVVTDEYDAYRIFESVNATGVDLSVSDLIKNMIFSNVRPTNDGLDPAEQSWSKMRKTLEEIGVDIARFVRYHWISRSEFITQSQLYKEVKRQTEENTGWEDLLYSLTEDAGRLSVLMQGEIPNPKSLREIERINSSLLAIRSMGFSQCYVLFLSLLRNQKRLNIAWDVFSNIVQKIEEFNFKYHAVCRLPANRVERNYSSWANAIQSLPATEIGQLRMGSTIAEIEDSLNKLMPSRDDFLSEFPSRTSYNSSLKRKNLIRYILGGIEKSEFESEYKERPIDSSISIEHILPQNPDIAWGLSEEDVLPYVHRIGNLVLVGAGLNSSAKNFHLSRKIEELKATAILSTQRLLSQICEGDPVIWTESEINARTDLIARFVFDEMW